MNSGKFQDAYLGGSHKERQGKLCYGNFARFLAAKSTGLDSIFLKAEAVPDIRGWYLSYLDTFSGRVSKKYKNLRR